MGGDPRVVFATSVNPKIVRGRLFLNVTSGTHIYLDKETDAGERFFFRLIAQYTGPTPVAPPLRSCAKVETLSIAELTGSSQDIDFICTGKVTGIKMDKGWCYVSCKTVPGNINGLYRVAMSIADKTGEGLFVGFDGVMAKLDNMKAYEAVHLLDGEGVNPEETDAPLFVKNMVGKSYTFQVRVGSYNFTANHRSFTISRILSGGDRVPHPEFLDDGGGD